MHYVIAACVKLSIQEVIACLAGSELQVHEVLLNLLEVMHNYLSYKNKFTVVYCESVNLIGYITVCYLLIVNSYASVHIARNV